MNVIELFRNDLWNGIWQHAKKLLKPMITPTAIALIIGTGICYIAYLVVKPMLPPEIFQSGGITDPEQMIEMMEQITEAMMANLWSFMAKMFGISVLFAVLSAWYYNTALLISKQVVETEEANPQEAISNSFGQSFVRMLGFAVIMAVLSAVVSGINSGLQSIMPGIAFLVNLLLQVILLRLFAGRAWIVFGDQSVVDGIKLSWENITFVRALKLFLIFIVGAIAVGLMLSLVFGLSMFAGKAGVMLFLLATIFVTYVISVVGVAGLAASFYRYVEIEYEETNTPEDHIIDSEA